MKIVEHRSRKASWVFLPAGLVIILCHTIFVASGSVSSEEIIMYSIGKPVTTLAFSSDSRLLAVNSNKDIVLWNVLSRKKVARIQREKGYPQSIWFSPNSSLLYCSRWNGVVEVWGLARGNLIRSRNILDIVGRSDEDDGLSGMLLSPDGKALLYATNEENWGLLDSRTFSILWKGPRNLPVLGARFILGGKFLMTSHMDGRLRVWQARTRQLVRTFKSLPSKQPPPSFYGPHAASDVALIGGLRISADGCYLVGDTHEGLGCLWDFRTGHLLNRFGSKEKYGLQIVGFLGRSSLVICLGGGGLQIWDPLKGNKRAVFPGNKVFKIATVSPDGRWIAVTDWFTCEGFVYDMKKFQHSEQGSGN